MLAKKKKLNLSGVNHIGVPASLIHLQQHYSLLAEELKRFGQDEEAKLFAEVAEQFLELQIKIAFSQPTQELEEEYYKSLSRRGEIE